MNTFTLLSIIALTLLLTTTPFAQDNSVPVTDANEIFNSIMQTMPGDMLDKIDSAATTQRTMMSAGTLNQQSLTNTQQSSNTINAKQTSLDKLPESVREQVRKTMLDLEKESTERRLQFKEARNKQNVK